MKMFSDCFRWTLSKLFGVKWVNLIDFDGEIAYARRARVRNGEWGAYRWRLSREIWIVLRPHGETHGASFVRKWELYEFFTPRTFFTLPPFPSSREAPSELVSSPPSKRSSTT